MYSLGVYMVGRHLSVKSIFKVPFIYASIAGTLVWVFHIELPEFVLQGTKFLGDAALPILVLMLGYSLNNMDMSRIGTAVSGGAIRIFGGLAISSAFVVVMMSFGVISNLPGDH
jgi:predicted permease